MLRIDKGTLRISEQTIIELTKAIEKAKEETSFTDEPMPDGDMDKQTYISLKRKRGEILVSSPYANLDFIITLNVLNQDTESLGYRLE